MYGGGGGGGYQTSSSALDRALSNVQSYQDPGRVRTDIESLLVQIPSLQPNHAVFTHDDGTSSTLVNLTGTIPIFYNGNQYNIPMEIWVPEVYPFMPPTSYVRPTSDMMIKPGHPQVNPNGLVTIPYISQWNGNTHSLVELVATQCSLFGSIPPVFRRPPNVAMQRPSYSRPAQPMQYQTQAAARPPPQYQTPVAARPPPPVVVDRRKQIIHELTPLIQYELRKLYRRIREETDAQHEFQTQLESGRDAVRAGLASIEDYKSRLEISKAECAERQVALEAWLVANEEASKDETKSVDVDEILIPTDKWSQQMFEAMAEHLAMDDLLYHMDRALSNSEITLPIFLKEVQKLSRQQFINLALMQAIVHKQQHHHSSSRLPPN